MSRDDMTPRDEETMRALDGALPRVAPPPGLGDRIAAANSLSEPWSIAVRIVSFGRIIVLVLIAFPSRCRRRFSVCLW